MTEKLKRAHMAAIWAVGSVLFATLLFNVSGELLQMVTGAALLLSVLFFGHNVGEFCRA